MMLRLMIALGVLSLVYLWAIGVSIEVWEGATLQIAGTNG